jgi:hypothetical protein
MKKIDELIREWFFLHPAGFANKPYTKDDLTVLENAMVSLDYSYEEITDVLSRLFEKIDPDKSIKYKDKDGESKQMPFSSAVKQKDDHPARIAADKLRSQEQPADKKEPEQVKGASLFKNPEPGSTAAKSSDKDVDAKTSEMKKMEVGQEVEVDTKPSPKHDKTLKQDIDFSGENTPTSITEDGSPNDAQFENKFSDPPSEEEEQKNKERGKKVFPLKKMGYKQESIEINGKTYNQPLSEEDVASFFPNPPHKISKKYIKALQRSLSIQYRGRGNERMSDCIDGVGAGEFPAQTAELITLMGASIKDPAERKQFFDTLNATVKNQSNKGVIDSKWVEASQASSNAIARQVKEDFGEDAEIEYAGWDVKSDVEDGIGLPYGNKGFSTDAYFRVKTSEGPKIYEVSLKKDLETFFASLGAPSLQKKLDKAMKEKGGSFYEAEEGMTVEEVQSRDAIENLTKNLTKRTNKRASELSEKEITSIVGEKGQTDEERSKKRKEIEQNAIEHAPSRPINVKKQLLAGSAKTGYELSDDAKNVLDFHEKMRDSGYPPPWSEEQLNDPEFKKIALENGVNLNKKDRRNKLMVYTNYLLYTQELANGQTDGPAYQFLNNQLGIEKPPPAGSARDVQNKHIENLARPETRDVLMDEIREKFPLEALMSGDESMALSNQILDRKTCIEIFGTDNYDQVNKSLKLDEDADGNKTLVYKVESTGEIITVAVVRCRQRGVGYSAPTTEISPSEEIKHRLYCANRDKIPQEEYTKSEKGTIKKVIDKFGDCENATYRKEAS